MQPDIFQRDFSTDMTSKSSKLKGIRIKSGMIYDAFEKEQVRKSLTRLYLRTVDLNVKSCTVLNTDADIFLQHVLFYRKT